MRSGQGTPELLKDTEVARIFQVSRTTVGRWARQGLLTPVKVAGTVRYRASEVAQLAEDGGPPDVDALPEPNQEVVG